MIPPRVRHLVLVVAGIALVGTGLVLTQAQPRADVPELGQSPAVPPPRAAQPVPRLHEPVPLPPVQEPVAAPTAVSLPGRAAPVPVVPVGALGSGALQLPERPTVLGWYAAGAVPGDLQGTAVIAGHVDSAVYGAGPLESLYRLRLGDVVEVTDAAGTRRGFAVTARTSYAKPALPAEVFRTDGPPRLVLITCGGAFDERARSYSDNVVVLAAPVG